MDLAPVQGLDEQRVPARALLVSAGALVVPIAATLLTPTWVEEGVGLLVWLSALVPAFLLTYYRGWRGTSLALAVGMATMAMGEAALAAGVARPPSWEVVFALVVAYLSVCLGLGWVGELLHRARREAESAALMDALTGLPNRRHLDIFLRATYAAAQRGGTLAVVVFDLDRFKAVNDREGHAAGDAVLRAVGEVLLVQTRQSDVTVRFGGEEFVSVLPWTDETEALVFAARVREAVEALSFPWGGVTLSAGVAEYHAGLASPDLLLAEADRALYAAKDAGRNRVTRASEVRAGAGGGGVAAGPRKEDRAAKRGRVLLVESDPTLRHSLGRALERFGFDVTVVSDGREALEMMTWNLGVDVVLADVVMPTMGGLTLAERVAADGGERRVVLMSGYDVRAPSGSELPSGVAAFLSKPVSLPELVTALEAASPSAEGVP